MQLIIKINLVNYTNENDGMELGENIVAPLHCWITTPKKMGLLIPVRAYKTLVII